MNRKHLGEQIYGHLLLCKDLGIRYVDCPAIKSRTRIEQVPEKSGGMPVSASGFPPRLQADVVGQATPESFVVASKIEDQKNREAYTEIAPGGTLEAILEDMKNCQRCKLWSTRTNLVFGSGNPKAALMFVGEAPGEDEDRQGLPFVGRAGRLLTLIIESIGFRREDVFICNILKCRPPQNRNPETDEIAGCEGFLFRQIAAVQPRVIVALGSFGAQTLLGTTEAIGKLRGRLTNYRGVKLMATYHPAYLLRSPFEKRKVWEDMRIVRDYLRAMPE